MRANNSAKAEVISFKADTQLAAALNALDNRSEFIRQALRMSLDRQCPLCAGGGVLDEDQQRHLRAFLRNHEIHECERCHALHLDDKPDPAPAPDRRGRVSGRRRGAAVLAVLFLMSSLAAGLHRSSHDHCDRRETHSRPGVCAACIFAAAPMLAGDFLQVDCGALPLCLLPQPETSVWFSLLYIEPRSRGPPPHRA